MMTPVYEGNPRNIDQMQGSGMFDGMSYFETPTSQMRNMADFSSNFQFRKSPLMQSPCLGQLHLHVPFVP